MRHWILVVCLVGCGDDAVGKLPDAPPPPACAAVTGAGTMHVGTVATAETWTAADSPHLVPADLTVSATVTIEACAVVRIADDRSINVRAGGSLVAAGMPDLPVTIERADPTASWASIAALGGGTLSFTHTNITGGGDPLNRVIDLAGAIDVAGSAPPTAGILHVDHVSISGSESNGVNLHDGGGFDASSTDLTITGSVVAPIVTFARHVGTIPSGTYTGNTEDAIVIRGTGGPEAIAEDATMHARGVPYRVGLAANAVLDVVNVNAPPTLTIEPGVKLKFTTGSTLRIDPASGTTPAAGTLIAAGTLVDPIIFTSAADTPAAGDWFGIWLGRAPTPATKIDHARVEFAGRASGSGSDSCIPVGQTGPNDAAIRILGGIPASVFITNTHIVSSARHGIDLGFRSDAKPDFATPNTFTNVPRCATTTPRDANGACPVVTCP